MSTLREEAMKEIDGLMKLYADAATLTPEVTGVHQVVAAEVFAALAVAYCSVKNLPDPELDNEATDVHFVELRSEDAAL